MTLRGLVSYSLSMLDNGLNLSLGKFVRAIQRMLIPRQEPIDLIERLRDLAILDSADYAQTNLTEAVSFKDKSLFYKYCVERSGVIDGGVILEFGVWSGATINDLAKLTPSSRLFGFDSFEGLEEDWVGTGLKKGTFDKGGKMPNVAKNVTLIKGWFEDTLPKFMDALGTEYISIVNFDADTYKPAVFVLKTIKPNLKVGTIVIFDEYFGYPNWRAHEFRAWQEFVHEHQISYKYIAFTQMAVAVLIVA
jgi:hypothetical protein